MFCYEFFYYFEGRGRSEKLFFCYFQNIFSQTICIRVFENIGKRTTIRFLKFPLVWGYPEAFKMEQANSKNILKMIISISKKWSLFHFFMNILPIFSFFYFQIQIWTYKWTWKGKKKKRMDDVSTYIKDFLALLTSSEIENK